MCRLRHDSASESFEVGWEEVESARNGGDFVTERFEMEKAQMLCGHVLPNCGRGTGRGQLDAGEGGSAWLGGNAEARREATHAAPNVALGC